MQYVQRRMVEAIDSIQHIRQRFIVARQAFYAWCAHLRQVHSKQAQQRRACAHHALLHLQGRPLLFWRHWTRVERHSRAKADMEASLQRQQDAVFAEANARIEAMHAEVGQSRFTGRAATFVCLTSPYQRRPLVVLFEHRSIFLKAQVLRAGGQALL